MIATVSYGCVYFALRAVVSFEQARFLSIRPISGSKTAAGYVVVVTATSLPLWSFVHLSTNEETTFSPLPTK